MLWSKTIDLWHVKNDQVISTDLVVWMKMCIRDSPMVVIDNFFAEFPYHSITTENEKSAYRAVKYLAEKGHKKIGFVNSLVAIDNFKMREKGYRQALKETGLTEGFNYRIDVSPTMEGAYQDMKAYLKAVSYTHLDVYKRQDSCNTV